MPAVRPYALARRRRPERSRCRGGRSMSAWPSASCCCRYSAELSTARAVPASIVALRRLVAAGVVVAVISGRSREALQRVLTVPGVRLLGDYGLDRANPGEVLALQAFNERVLSEFTDVEGVVVEPKP